MKTTFTSTEAASRSRWMIVDDNESILEMMHAIVARFTDASIECFNSPLAALAAFTAEPEAFELVITDFEMPGMNGVELCHELHAASPAAKIILATGSGLMSDEAAAHEGFCGLLQKPFPFATLQRVLDAAGVGKISKNSFNQRAALTTA
jgi:CheY-like chemotaxis protein